MSISTVHGIEQQIRYPEIGQLKIGEKVATQNGGERPNQLDHFKLVPKEGYDYLKGCFYEAYGASPKSLNILLPWDTIEGVMPVAYQAWKKSGLWCEGDNKEATRYDLTGTGSDVHMACHETCPIRQSGDCKLQGRLRVLLPDMPALAGAYTIKASPSSVRAVLGCLHAIQGMHGRLSGVEMIMSLQPFKGATGATNYRLHLDLAQGQPTLREVLAQGPGSAPLLAPASDGGTLLGEEVEQPAEEEPEAETNGEKPPYFRFLEKCQSLKTAFVELSDKPTGEGFYYAILQDHGLEKSNEAERDNTHKMAAIVNDLELELIGQECRVLLLNLPPEEQEDGEKNLKMLRDKINVERFRQHLEQRIGQLELEDVPLN